MIRSAFDFWAWAKARSIAPGSSGLGNATVGKSGSGSAWAATSSSGSKPARANTARTTELPTPCMDVCTMFTARGESGATSPLIAET